MKMTNIHSEIRSIRSSELSEIRSQNSLRSGIRYSEFRREIGIRSIHSIRYSELSESSEIRSRQFAMTTERKRNSLLVRAKFASEFR
jgi:hypothetical protein